MNLRTPHLLALLALCLPAVARADLEIVSARYGTDSAYRDVRGVLEAYLRSNTLSFPVNARSMGGDPTPRELDSLAITYRVNARTFTDTVREGAIFTFQGVPNVTPVRPPLNLPFLRPLSPVTAPLVIINRSGMNSRLYCVDRFGSWTWGADIQNGQTLSLTGKAGEEWIAMDEGQRVLARQRLGRGDNQLWINEPGQTAPTAAVRGEEAWVRFENTGYRPLYLYNLDPVGRWNWMATIEPGGGYSASTHVGETWIATDTGNRIVRQTVVGPGMAHVKLN